MLPEADSAVQPVVVFSNRTYPRLLAFLSQMGGRWSKHVAFLGAPTLGAVLFHSPPCYATILDIDTAVLGPLRLTLLSEHIDRAIRCCNRALKQSCEASSARVPCGPAVGTQKLKRFLETAAELVCENATIAMTVPQLLTRPGVVKSARIYLNLRIRCGPVPNPAVTECNRIPIPVRERTRMVIRTKIRGGRDTG